MRCSSLMYWEAGRLLPRSKSFKNSLHLRSRGTAKLNGNRTAARRDTGRVDWHFQFLLNAVDVAKTRSKQASAAMGLDVSPALVLMHLRSLSERDKRDERLCRHRLRGCATGFRLIFGKNNNKHTHADKTQPRVIYFPRKQTCVGQSTAQEEGRCFAK